MLHWYGATLPCADEINISNRPDMWPRHKMYTDLQRISPTIFWVHQGEQEKPLSA